MSRATTKTKALGGRQPTIIMSHCLTHVGRTTPKAEVLGPLFGALAAHRSSVEPGLSKNADGKNIANGSGNKRSRKGAVAGSSSGQAVMHYGKDWYECQQESKYLGGRPVSEDEMETLAERYPLTDSAMHKCRMGPAFQEPINDDDATTDEGDGSEKDKSNDSGPEDNDIDASDEDSNTSSMAMDFSTNVATR
ncbi:hypothetical protein KY289_025607 [Solanum tuberosum]|nr:hypothetical protein KY289_025607 [Solanum tuberosum]